MWLLLLFDGCERAGLSPLSVERLHRLVYLANALAPVYEILLPDGYILKYRRGPFFPAVHWDIGRLVAQGLILARNAKAIKDNIGYWVSADYTLSAKGMTIVDTALGLESITPRALYLREVALAFAVLGPDSRDESALADVNFKNAIEDTPVYYGDDEHNLAPLAARSLTEEEAPQVRRLKLHRYFQYLERAWEDPEQRHAS
jgi:hypothetical protein